MKCFAISRGILFVEIWSKLSDGKPVDSESPLYKEITRVLDFYVAQPFIARQPNFFERLILRYQFAHAQYVSDEEKNTNRLFFFRFILKHRLAKQIKQCINIQYLLAFAATKEVEAFEKSQKEQPSSAYWKGKIREVDLPAHLRGAIKPRRIRIYLRKEIKKAKRELALKNYRKLDLSVADLNAMIALSGTLLLALGYLRVASVNWWFGIPYQRYFALSDYLASSINSVGGFLFSSVIAVAFWWFAHFAVTNSYSMQEHLYRSFGDRLNKWIYNSVAISALVALGAVYYRERRVDPDSFFFVVMFIGLWSLTRVAALFFADPIKTYLYASVIFLASLGGVTDAIREINRITSPGDKLPNRTLTIGDADYSEPTWRVINITSGFVIMRRYEDGLVQVFAKGELKSVKDAVGAR